MIKLFRPAAALGAGIFASSFFLPFYFYNSPRMRFLWAVDAAFPLGDWGISLAFFAAAGAMAYPYLWGASAAFTALFPRRGLVLLQLGIHLAGAVLISGLSLTLLLTGDRALPVPVLWIGVIFFPVFLLLLVLIYRRASRAERWGLLTGTGSFPFIPLQIIIGRAVVADGGSGWGYFLGAAGTALCLAGALFSRIRSPIVSQIRDGR